MEDALFTPRWALLGLLAPGACHPGSVDAPDLLAATSSTVVPAVDGSSLYVVDVEQGTLSRLATDGGAVHTLAVGSEPTRITRGGDRLYLALRGGDEVVAVDDVDGSLVIVDRTTVGAGPFGIVASQDGGPLYVAVSGEDRVLELDPETLGIGREWSMAGEPRWLALDPLGRALYVAAVEGDALTRIDLLEGELDTVTLPPVGSATARATGEPCVSSDGALVAVPAWYEDPGSSRADPALVTFDQGEEGLIGEGEVVLARADPRTPRAALATALCTPDPSYALLSMEAGDTVLLVDLRPFDPDAREVRGFSRHPTTRIRTADGPQGLAFAGEVPYVHTWLDRGLSRFRWEDAVEINAHAGRAGDAGSHPVLKTFGFTHLAD